MPSDSTTTTAHTYIHDHSNDCIYTMDTLPAGVSVSFKRLAIATLRKVWNGGRYSNPPAVKYYYRHCTHQRCMEQVTVYKVCEDTSAPIPIHSYYYDDYTITANIGDHATRSFDRPFCSFRCLRLWATQQERGTEK